MCLGYISWAISPQFTDVDTATEFNNLLGWASINIR